MAPSASAPPPSFAQLEQAALHIVRLMSDTPGLENTKLAVTGDLAVCKYLPQHGRVESIDFVISKSSSPSRVKKEIVNHPMSPLFEKAGLVYIKLSTGQQVEVKMIPDWLSPYLPAAARPVRENTNALPYISIDDLIVFKVDACGLREREASKRQEACVAAALLELASEHGPIDVDEDKLDRIEQALPEILEFCDAEHDKSWWQRRLGGVPDKRRSVQEILSDLAEHPTSPSAMSSPPTSPRAPLSKRSSMYSTMSRTSSSTSSISNLSTFSSMTSITTPDDEIKPLEKSTRPRKLSVTGHSKKHARHPSSGVAPTNARLEDAIQRMHIGRPASPGVALTNQI
ncbi:hypothetical protein V2G26_005721 [Clonostachys chloroleuca]|uniref:Uncharacterized protein n=1 Tax=Clonostachys chloroleuca TaxID=1926264 RepID=A0AA35VAL8_9HYPO|nr:unnamed protein product [Clonostachys chloroleuca]